MRPAKDDTRSSIADVTMASQPRQLPSASSPSSIRQFAAASDHPIVWINLVGCSSSRRSAIKVPAVRADLVAGSAYFAAMLDGPYRESLQSSERPIDVDIPPLRDAVSIVGDSVRGRLRRSAPDAAEWTCSVFIRTLTGDGRPPEPGDVLLLWRALCFVGASHSVLARCASIVYGAMGVSVAADTSSTIAAAAAVADDGGATNAKHRDRHQSHTLDGRHQQTMPNRAKRARIHTEDRPDNCLHFTVADEPFYLEERDDNGDGTTNDGNELQRNASPGFENDMAVDDGVFGGFEFDAVDSCFWPRTVAGPGNDYGSVAMPALSIVAGLYALLGDSLRTAAADDEDGATIRDPVADALLPVPWARFGLDWARTSGAQKRSIVAKVRAYMRFGEQVIQSRRDTLCKMARCASDAQGARTFIAMMHDWATALWPAERLGLLTTSVNAFGHPLAKVVLPDATPRRFASVVVSRFPTFGRALFDLDADAWLGVFGRLPQGVVLAGSCALYALCRSTSLSETRDNDDNSNSTNDGIGDDGGSVDSTDDDAGPYVCSKSKHTIATCASVPPGDMDLFLVGPTDSARRIALASIVKIILDAVPDCQAAIGSNVITMRTLHAPDERLQLIFTNKTRAGAVPAGFDMSHLGVACSRDDSVLVSWGALHALMTGKAVATPGRVVTPDRVLKASARGFVFVGDTTIVTTPLSACVDATQDEDERQDGHDAQDDDDNKTKASTPFVACPDVATVLDRFVYGHVVNDNYTVTQPRAHGTATDARSTQRLGASHLRLLRVPTTRSNRFMAVDEAPATIVFCPTLCALAQRPARIGDDDTLRLSIEQPGDAFSDLTPSAMAIADLRRAEVDLMRRTIEAHSETHLPGQSSSARARCWRGSDRGLSLRDACTAVLAGVVHPWWGSPLTKCDGSRGGVGSMYNLHVHVSPDTHLSDGITGRRMTLDKVRGIQGGASVAATVVVGGAVCEDDDTGPFVVVATLVSAIFYPPDVSTIVDVLTKGAY